jgi:hypothetical protein
MGNQRQYLNDVGDSKSAEVAGIEIGDTAAEDGPNKGPYVGLGDSTEGEAMRLSCNEGTSDRTQMEISSFSPQELKVNGPSLRTWKCNARQENNAATNVGLGQRWKQVERSKAPRENLISSFEPQLGKRKEDGVEGVQKLNGRKVKKSKRDCEQAVRTNQWWRLETSPASCHDSFKLELPGAWEPPCNSRPLPLGEGEETYLFVSHGNKK